MPIWTSSGSPSGAGRLAAIVAALAVLRRPDVFHAAVAGAPVTDHRLYDTHYMERYLGHPDEEPENYERCSLIPDAPGLRRPLLLIHGLADDNVVVAHTLRLSAALMAAGRPHSRLAPERSNPHDTPGCRRRESVPHRARFPERVVEDVATEQAGNGE